MVWIWGLILLITKRRHVKHILPASQTYNGWEHFKTYEDGGTSALERPGLQQMLKDVKAGHIQLVLVYKVDRLSRSIMDFHHMMKELERYNCNFVSITQAFDTSNSMGKLTLNMLLSFAQFEREVSSERVRDKIAATKAKGLWVGGSPILGYDIVEKQLVVNEGELAVVRKAFEKYLELDSIYQVSEWLGERKIKTKKWFAKHSKSDRDGKSLSVSYLHRMLRNPIYIGKIPHYALGKVYEGKHQAILPKELFQAVQDKLGRHYEKNAQCKAYTYSKCLFKKTLLDEAGNVFGITSSKKENKRFYYYFNRKGISLPMAQLDNMAMGNVNRLLEVGLKGLLAEDIKDRLKYIPAFKSEDIKRFIDKAICRREEKINKVAVYVDIAKLAKFAFKHLPDRSFIRKKLLKNDSNISISSDNKFLIITFEFILDNSKSTKLHNTCAKNILTVSQMNESLVRGIAYGWKFARELENGKTVTQLEKESGLQKRRIYKYINLKYLSPKIIKGIFENKNPKNIRLVELMNLADKSLNFNEQ